MNMSTFDRSFKPIRMVCHPFLRAHQHNKPTDLWVIIDSNVYDLTKFIEVHPGGRAVLLDEDVGAFRFLFPYCAFLDWNGVECECEGG